MRWSEEGFEPRRCRVPRLLAVVAAVRCGRGRRLRQNGRIRVGRAGATARLLEREAHSESNIIAEGTLVRRVDVTEVSSEMRSWVPIVSFVEVNVGLDLLRRDIVEIGVSVLNYPPS
jgi:hypothetical protein